jgi:DNA-binding winged helix-turn-helix (wHTH) protein
MPRIFGEYDYIDAGEADYKKLFNSYWCPLFGRMPDVAMESQDSDASRSVDIIENARELWGINPCRQYTPTDKLIVSTSDETKGILSYPQLRLDAALAIERTYPQTKKDINAEEWNKEETLDSDSERAVNIVRKLADSPLDDWIKDYHILAVLAIAEAWDILRNVLYDKEKKDISDIKDQVLVATKLLAKAVKQQEVYDSKVIIKVENNCLKRMDTDKKGRLLPIQIKLLKFLYEKKNIHVTREDIFKHLWNGSNVYDDQITDHLSKLVEAFVNLDFKKTVVKKEIIETLKKSSKRKSGYIFHNNLILLDYD